MATQSLTQPQRINHYSIKEFQLLVKDAAMVPAEIEPFVGSEYSSSADIYLYFHGLAEMPVETFVVLHLNTKNLFIDWTAPLWFLNGLESQARHRFTLRSSIAHRVRI